MDKTTKQLWNIFGVPAILIAVIWVVFLLDLLPSYRYGLIPRSSHGLTGIFTSPFMHGGLQHIMSNTVPLFVLTSLILFFYKRVAVQSILMIYLLTGFSVWLFARPANHIGASGVVYGMVSFVFWSGIFRRDLKSIVLALVITVMYSGYFYGILPNQDGVSWESHLFGGIIGIFTAYFLKDMREPEDEDYAPLEEEESTEYLFPKDLFDKTKSQREWEEKFGSGGDHSDSTW